MAAAAADEDSNSVSRSVADGEDKDRSVVQNFPDNDDGLYDFGVAYAYNTRGADPTFLPVRCSIASYASAGIAKVPMSVRLSVRLSHSGIVSKRRKLA